MGVGGVGGVEGVWAGDGRGGGFPDTKSWDFCSYFKKTVPFLSFPIFMKKFVHYPSGI